MQSYLCTKCFKKNESFVNQITTFYISHPILLWFHKFIPTGSEVICSYRVRVHLEFTLLGNKTIIHVDL